jgi:asparagine synthetase B (glutamine-hydrolysing)
VSSFAGALNAEGPGRPDVVSRMLSAAPHRGTQTGVAVLGRAAAGVSDLSGEADAWVSRDEGLLVAVSGRIDNLTELAKRFQERDSRAGASPAEVIAAVFRALGDRAPTAPRGVYAAFVSDGERAWTWRDHLSFGQALYRQDARGFFVATEAKQVVAGAGLPREPDVGTVERWFFGQVEPGETAAPLRGVQRAARATILTSDGRRASRRRYWDPGDVFETGRYSEGELVERFEELMAQAVDRTLTGNDVISLSGGIDSPAVAAFAAERHLEISGRPIGALSLVFPDFPEVDESRYIEMVALPVGAAHLPARRPAPRRHRRVGPAL